MTRKVRTLEEWRARVPDPPRRSKAAPFEEYYVSVGRIVSEMRERLGMTQQFLAVELGVDASTVSRIENGTMRFPVHEYPRLAKALSLPVSSLFPPGFLHGVVPSSRKER